jgi:hypothetical protein
MDHAFAGDKTVLAKRCIHGRKLSYIMIYKYFLDNEASKKLK